MDLMSLITTYPCDRGTYAFTACIKGFGAVVATGMGIGRKFLSILMSYLIFPKHLLIEHMVSLVVVMNAFEPLKLLVSGRHCYILFRAPPFLG